MAQPAGIPLVPGALKDILATRGVTIAQLADAIGRDRRTLDSLAAGRRPRASYGTATLLLWRLDVQPSRLFVLPWPALGESHDTHHPSQAPDGDWT